MCPASLLLYFEGDGNLLFIIDVELDFVGLILFASSTRLFDFPDKVEMVHHRSRNNHHQKW
jgi:hypothetical protein